MQESGICPKCGKEKKQVGSGSLTQWIAACTCDQIDSGTVQYESLKICQDCGKRVGSARSGSFTQWIFRQDLCACKQSILSESSIQSDDVETVRQSNKNEKFETSDSLIELQVQEFPSDRYLPFRKLGSGVQSEVYLSKDRLLDKLVAVKIMRSLSSDQVVAFQNEAKATSALSHPNIVKVLDFGVSSAGAPYMVLEYVNGQRLDSYLKSQGPLAWSQALTVVSQICDALSVAHASGIFHRDIKPGNILLVIDDSNSLSAQLIDFGIATIQKSNQGSTSPEVESDISGTPAYMSPEQAGGKYEGAPSENFSIGCVLYECLTGKQLFEVDDTITELVRRSQEYSEADLSFESIEAPDPVKSIMKRCLAKYPVHRYPTVDDLNSAIQSVLDEADELLDSSVQSEENESSSHGLSKQKTNRMGLISRFTFKHGVVAIALLALASWLIIQSNFVVDNSPKIKSKKVAKNVETTASKSAFEEMHKTESNPTISEELDLSGRATTDENLSGLEYRPIRILKLNGASITDSGLETVGKIQTLESLYLTRVNLITAKGLEHITKLNKLALLKLNTTRLGNEALPVVAKIESLEKLSLMNLSLTEEALLPLANHPSLKDIDVNRSKIRDGIGVLRSVKSMEIIRVGTNGVTDKGVKAIDGLPNLTTLHIQGNPITGASLKIIAKWPKLKDLWLSQTNVKAKDLPVLNKAKALEILRLDTLHLNDNNISYLMGLNQIKNLTLRENDITDKGLLNLASIASLESLDVKDCKKISLSGIGKLLKLRPDLLVRTDQNGRLVELKLSDFRFKGN